jgi:hypothetical protein
VQSHFLANPDVSHIHLVLGESAGFV